VWEGNAGRGSSWAVEAAIRVPPLRGDCDQVKEAEYAELSVTRCRGGYLAGRVGHPGRRRDRDRVYFSAVGNTIKEAS